MVGQNCPLVDGGYQALNSSKNYRLLAIAAVKGIGVAVGSKGLSVFQMDDVRNAVQNGEKPSSLKQISAESVQLVEFTSDQANLVIVFTNGSVKIVPTIHLASISDLSGYENVLQGEGISNVKRRPNSRQIAVLKESGQVVLLDSQSHNVLKLCDSAKALSWSPQGKQILVGKTDKSLVQYLPSGEPRQAIFPPQDFREDSYISNILWLKAHVILVAYSLSSDPDDHTADTYLIKRGVDDKTVITWNKVPEPCPPFGDPNRAETWYSDFLHDWSSEYDFVIPLAYGPSSDISLITEKNAIAMLEDSHQAMLPFSEEETSPIGMAIDVFSNLEVANPIPDIDSSVAQPIVWVLNNEGLLCGWSIISKVEVKRGHGLEELQEKQRADVEAASLESQTPTPEKPAPAPSAISQSSPSSFTPKSLFNQSPGQAIFGHPSGASSFAWGGAFGTGSPGFGNDTGFGNSSFGSSPFAKPNADQTKMSTIGSSLTNSSFSSSPFATDESKSSNLRSDTSGVSFGKSPFARQVVDETKPSIFGSTFSNSGSAFAKHARSAGISDIFSQPEEIKPEEKVTSIFGATPATGVGIDNSSFSLSSNFASSREPSTSIFPSPPATASPSTFNLKGLDINETIQESPDFSMTVTPSESSLPEDVAESLDVAPSESSEGMPEGNGLEEKDDDSGLKGSENVPASVFDESDVGVESDIEIDKKELGDEGFEFDESQIETEEVSRVSNAKEGDENILYQGKEVVIQEPSEISKNSISNEKEETVKPEITVRPENKQSAKLEKEESVKPERRTELDGEIREPTEKPLTQSAEASFSLNRESDKKSSEENTPEEDEASEESSHFEPEYPRVYKAPLLNFGSELSTPLTGRSAEFKLHISNEVDAEETQTEPTNEERPEPDGPIKVGVIDSDFESDVEEDPGIAPYNEPTEVKDDTLEDFDLFYKEVNVLFNDVERNISNLKRAVRWNAHSGQIKQADSLDSPEKWRLSDASSVVYILDGLGSKLAAVGRQERDGESQIPDLKKSLASLCLQLSRIQEIIRYKEGETNERALLLRSLPVNAIELQRKLRSSSASLEDKLNLLENDINLLKVRLSSMSMTRPSAHTIRNSIYQISLCAQQRLDKVAELEKLVKSKLKVDESQNGGIKASLKGFGSSYQSPRSISREMARNDVEFLVRKSKRDNNRQLAEFLYNRPEEDIMRKITVKQARFQ